MALIKSKKKYQASDSICASITIIWFCVNRRCDLVHALSGKIQGGINRELLVEKDQERRMRIVGEIPLNSLKLYGGR